MSALDDLISSSEGLSLAPAEAVALAPAVKAPSGKSPAGGSNLAIAGKRVALFRAPDVSSFADMCLDLLARASSSV
eukprot:scaffold31654_cov38-Attheya_sp.AAC.1